jgi:alpha-aminoadipate/glutamate carrier protein LysW
MAGMGIAADAGTRRRTEMTGECPECAAAIELSGVEQGEIVPCPECGVELEVLGTEPLVLGLAPEEGEDWGE